MLSRPARGLSHGRPVLMFTDGKRSSFTVRIDTVVMHGTRAIAHRPPAGEKPLLGFSLPAPVNASLDPCWRGTGQLIFAAPLCLLIVAHTCNGRVVVPLPRDSCCWRRQRPVTCSTVRRRYATRVAARDLARHHADRNSVCYQHHQRGTRTCRCSEPDTTGGSLSFFEPVGDPSPILAVNDFIAPWHQTYH